MSAEQHVIHAIEAAALHEEPFAYCHVEGVFPQEYYDDIRRHRPPPEQMMSHAAAGRGDSYPHRSVLELTSANLQRLTGESRAFWRDLRSWLLGEGVRTAMLRKFAKAIDGRSAGEAAVGLDSDAVLIEDRTSHSLGPHTDHPRKVIAGLFYLPLDHGQAHLGTSMYRPLDAALRSDGLTHYRADLFERVRTIPFAPNSLLMFARTSASFHGVEPVRDPGCRRWLLMYNIIVRQSTRAQA
jgi:hypothetical protein